MSDDLSVRLRRLETIEAARGLVAEYANTVDERDLDRFSRIFSPDAVLSAGDTRHEGIDAIVEFFRTRFASDPTDRRHFVTNVRVVDASPTAATLTSYFLFTAGTNGESVLGWGRYTDRFAPADGELRFVAKHIAVEFRGPVDATWGGVIPGVVPR